MKKLINKVREIFSKIMFVIKGWFVNKFIPKFKQTKNRVVCSIKTTYSKLNTKRVYLITKNNKIINSKKRNGRVFLYRQGTIGRIVNPDNYKGLSDRDRSKYTLIQFKRVTLNLRKVLDYSKNHPSMKYNVLWIENKNLTNLKKNNSTLEFFKKFWKSHGIAMKKAATLSISEKAITPGRMMKVLKTKDILVRNLYNVNKKQLTHIDQLELARQIDNLANNDALICRVDYQRKTAEILVRPTSVKEFITVPFSMLRHKRQSDMPMFA